MNLDQYIESINKRYKLGNATEHTYRGDLQQLLENILPEYQVTNEPRRIECGAPDYIITKKDIQIAYIEAKDVGDQDLSGNKQNKAQFDRYKSLPNLIFTDYLDFHYYQNGEFKTSVRIADVSSKAIIPIPENFSQFESLIKESTKKSGQTIKSPEKLAEMMADKARFLADIINNALNDDENKKENSTLEAQYNAFQEHLIKDIKIKEFSDIYAQTITYGLFAARLHDPTLETFSRYEAAELIPKSNPFLRKLFSYIAGPDIDDRIKWIVDNLIEVFLACNVREILKNYGKSTKMEDPIIHFYETFLIKYDKKLRKARGVWYTPAPVVNFIVRAVDDILKDEFGLKNGIADNSKIKIKTTSQETDKRYKDRQKVYEEEVHRVQILDPATGTGTFLAEVIKHIHKKFEGQEGIWNKYVENDLIPRLNGFELLMASYAMAHLKLDLLLSETGYTSKTNQRLKVYLTNSLEEHHPDTENIFASWFSDEANEANYIKRDTPVMCVIGNPPYSGESANKGEWIMGLMEDYKKEPGGKQKLNERNPKWINDDYVKFIRYGQYYIEKNGSGILAFINPHGFLDNPTFRGMRWNLLKTFDKIYTIDLHGNSKKKEKAPDGSKDENVFDIQQGVSINFLIKTGLKTKNSLGVVKHYDIFGKRNIKYRFLNNTSFYKIKYENVTYRNPFYLFINQNGKTLKNYYKYFSINDLFKISGVGLTTAHDSFVIKDDEQALLNQFNKFKNSPRDSIFLHKEFNVKEKKGWNILEGYDNIKNENNLQKYIYPISYRPFDNKYVFYEDKLVWRTVRKVMNNFIYGNNVGLVSARSNKSETCDHFYISDKIMETKCGERTTQSAIFPLYIYPDLNEQENILGNQERQPNLDKEIIKEISKKLGLIFTNEKEDTEGTYAPIDLLDYIYAVLHSPAYREKYKEFLKIDFPRVPYPNIKTFWKLVELGKQIREIHLLESPIVEEYITKYPKDGINIVEKPIYKDGNVYINSEQYFEGVPEVAWNFYIGGYQPAQKWLKDRKDRELNFDDIMHYQKIIVALTETDRLMKEIDKVGVE